jgi:hypothetical protein
MKSVLLTTLLLAASFQAHADLFNCSQNEAQFIGQMTDIQRDVLDQNIVICSYRVQFSDYRASGICPLSESLAAEARFEAASCSSVAEGKEVSGYLVQKDGAIYIE